MKKVLLASTALVLSAGFAAADVTVGGDGRMGIIDPFNFTIDPDGVPNSGDEIQGGDTLGFTSRIRISFSASGETDGGLAFGGSIRADNAGSVQITDAQNNFPGDPGFDPNTVQLSAGGGNVGQAGDVFIEGGFGKLSMGDVDGAAKAAVGHVSGVGLTGLGDRNESTYIANVGPNLPGALYEYSGGAWSVYLSASNPVTVIGSEAPAIAYAIGGEYSFGNWNLALGYEDNDAGATHVIAGVTGSFGGFTGKVVFGSASFDASTGIADGDQWALSGDYTFGASTITAFYTDDEDLGGSEAWGLGYAYDLGGGASLVAGYASDETASDDAYDFGIKFSF